MVDKRLLEVDYATPPTAGQGLVFDAASGLFMPKTLMGMAKVAETTIQNISSLTLAVLGGCSKSIALDGSTSVFLLARGTVSTSNVADLIFLGLYRDATGLTELTQLSLPVAATTGKTDCFCVAAVDKPAAGTYTYSLKWSNDGTNTAYCRAASLHAISMRV